MCKDVTKPGAFRHLSSSVMDGVRCNADSGTLNVCLHGQCRVCYTRCLQKKIDCSRRWQLEKFILLWVTKISIPCYKKYAAAYRWKCCYSCNCLLQLLLLIIVLLLLLLMILLCSSYYRYCSFYCCCLCY